jgi:hypothetical protein
VSLKLVVGDFKPSIHKWSLFCVLKTCWLLKLHYAKIFYLFIGLFVFGNG